MGTNSDGYRRRQEAKHKSAKAYESSRIVAAEQRRSQKNGHGILVYTTALKLVQWCTLAEQYQRGREGLAEYGGIESKKSFETYIMEKNNEASDLRTESTETSSNKTASDPRFEEESLTPKTSELQGKVDSGKQPEKSCSTDTARKIGYASIKKEFLIPDYKPSLSSDYISSEMKAKMVSDENTDSVTQAAKELENNSDSDENEESEPPSKKAKLKGRNKQRPRNERILAKDKMCPAIKENRECKFGDNCKFNHDKADFMSKKLPDIKGTCYLFDTFGFCQFGITCRFSSNHLSENFHNIVKNDLFEEMKSKKKFLNELDGDVRQKLWKKKYNFKRADAIVKDIQKTFRGWDDQKAGEKSFEKKEGCSKSTGNLDATDYTPTTPEGINSTPDSPLLSKNEKAVSQTPSKIELQNENVEEVAKRFLSGVTDEDIIRVRPEETKKLDLKNKLYLAPLTTVGNLPFRRVCKGLGAEVTCGEMALVTQLLKAKQSEWSLIKRHPCEDIFGVQVCGSYPDTMTRCAQLLTETCAVDFIDINCGCPIDLIYKKGGGSALMGKATKLEQICRSMIGVMGNTPLTVKLRKGVFDDRSVAHQIIPRLRDAGVSLVTVHGRSREQRYTRQADWDYIGQCAAAGAPMPVFGNGDILSYEEANLHMQTHGVSGVMLARGALIKPWLFTEIKEQRHWDISSSERFDILRDYTNFGLEHWGSDHQGVENTRRFLLEWLSFLHRYIPVGVLEQVPQRINERPPYYIGRNDLETLMASANCADWIKISEMLLGPVPPNFKFLPKHKANAYQ
ncbi:tRNA-dihydrouridine(47) synthase [nad(p)(+)] [Plakobranchus ocellatus]|uniref:tRNA-dihydrouridine(47) synthase [NAD(P)(+)] n=1 Tax=Plakobranchus ocellatus TaxID=259542 RepID=A0AAV4AQJ1_9GAST|nr:tRNA-dihydrouridine(47) synthase [nad(p)(+)] [Plakobranchus ocellatus]